MTRLWTALASSTTAAAPAYQPSGLVWPGSVPVVQRVEYGFYYMHMNSPEPDRLLVTQTAGSATLPGPGGRLAADPEAAVAAELNQASAGWAALLAECAGLVLGYGEHRSDAARYRRIADLCIAAGVDKTLIEAWIEVGRQRATSAATLTHKVCVLAE
jgi:hypothetical protein